MGPNLQHKLIFMRWEGYGWLVGTIKDKFSPATPGVESVRQVQLPLPLDRRLGESYAHARELRRRPATAPYKSWVLLEEEVVVEGGLQQKGCC